ncbi:MAG: hypothetical protein OXQ29_22070 [Rhodospirillaceae bacterium]|nr:hypothetical protein [Rhodospirillaceae bacterium]
MKFELDHPLQDDDREKLADKLGSAQALLRTQSDGITILEIGPCKLLLEDGIVKVRCETP